MRVLVIDDEPQIRRLLSIALGTKGWEVFEASTGFEGIQEIINVKPDVVLLDLNLPDMDGANILSKIREWSTVPVIVLSVRESQDDIIKLLNLGADDYIVKPFYTNELMARLSAVCRRRTTETEIRYRYGDLTIDLEARKICRGESEIHVTVTEFAVLELLLRYAGKIVTRDKLLKEIWGPSGESEKGSLRVHIRALRRKLEIDPEHPELILTEPGVGYRMTVPDSLYEPEGSTAPSQRMEVTKRG
ncbi:MAG: response regulator transcription factor [Spirochaetaceae bacterium]|nr:response regulator transcription factor [Spirochaetaceae bacterium]